MRLLVRNFEDKEGMVLNLEYAKGGKGDNHGVLLKFGYGF
jgi:hypothetical protein